MSVTDPRSSNEQGASAVEYGLIVVAIAALVTIAVFALGIVVNDTYSGSCDLIQQNAAPSSTC